MDFGSRGALWLWHIPFLYQATLHSDWIHAAQHLSFFLTAVLFWSALYGMGRSAMNFGAATLYVFGTAVHCSALGALLTFSTVLWYPAYAHTTARWGLTALAGPAARRRHHVGAVRSRLHRHRACPDGPMARRIRSPPETRHAGRSSGKRGAAVKNVAMMFALGGALLLNGCSGVSHVAAGRASSAERSPEISCINMDVRRAT